MFHEMTVAGLKRQLPICKVSDDLYIAGFVMFSDVEVDGDDITVAFNPSYLIEGLSAITEPYVRMKMTTAVKPVEFNGQQEADSDESMDYRYLLVPMRFNN